MKRFTLFLFILFSFFTLHSVSAASKDKETRKILDATAERLHKAGGVNILFTATTIVGKQSEGRISGSMSILGKKFTMQTAEMLTWFDGKTQWSMAIGDDEVSMTEPTGTELQAINPYAFLDIYKQGFNYKMKRGTLSNGKSGYKVFMTADNSKQEIREIFLEIDEQYSPARVSMRQGKNQWVRIVVNSFKTGQKFTDEQFSFPKSKYPNAEIIDLR